MAQLRFPVAGYVWIEGQNMKLMHESFPKRGRGFLINKDTEFKHKLQSVEFLCAEDSDSTLRAIPQRIEASFPDRYNEMLGIVHQMLCVNKALRDELMSLIFDAIKVAIYYHLAIDPTHMCPGQQSDEECLQNTRSASAHYVLGTHEYKIESCKDLQLLRLRCQGIFDRHTISLSKDDFDKDMSLSCDGLSWCNSPAAA
ncbi:hypothetical protein N0V90_003932 [Kalmusia sp. IMI 367209]|nr:hypothetical protein N0V90_003932 [Kalmusia sp. IMI 367209]